MKKSFINDTNLNNIIKDYHHNLFNTSSTTTIIYNSDQLRKFNITTFRYDRIDKDDSFLNTAFNSHNNKCQTRSIELKRLENETSSYLNGSLFISIDFLPKQTFLMMRDYILISIILYF